MTRVVFDPHRTHRLHFPDLGCEVAGSEGETLFQAARRGGVRIVGACGGRGTCGSCMVRVAQGHVEDPEGEGSGGHHRWRRACRTKVRGDCVVEIAPRSLAPVARAEVGHDDTRPLGRDPRVATVDVTVTPPSLHDPVADVERVRMALGRPVSAVELPAARRLPGILRGHAWSARARIMGDLVFGFSPPGGATLGLAVDLGTTNAAAFLIDLESGRRLAALGIENPQASWGADLISRINHAIQAANGAEDLRGAIVAGLNTVVRDLCHAVGADVHDVVDAVVCGNTAMHHLLAGLPVHQLGRAPFVAAVRGGMDVRASDVGLDICPGARIHLVANIGGFVGGDHVTALLGTEHRWSGVTALVMDIGTNTEISLLSEDRILSTSCPSGPALEGGHISCGMRAADGAIERVAVVDGRVAVKTIANKKAIGLCGSGVLDAVAVLHGAGIVDHGGRLIASHPDVGEAAGARFARLAPEVHFTQHDIRAVQLAKAAIRTATDLLLRQAGLSAAAVDRFIIAGAFGSYVDIGSGVAIGMFPDLPRERFEQVGNAAGLGVCRMLTDRADMARAEELARRAIYVELNTIPEFQKEFLKNIRFPATPQ
ncbi:MAG: DUF4445 domain-containing protein [Rhodospirillales bacterium]|nr:DUF4445 domain-containing protein [Rhodospirillales bacterium]